MPDLAALPSGSRVFVDTNIFHYHYAGRSATCSAFVRRIARGEITAYVNTEVLSDLMHKLMLMEAHAKAFIVRPTAGLLKAWLIANRASAGTLVDYQQQFNNTLTIGLQTINITQTMMRRTQTERCDHGLMTNDSLHLGCMIRSRAHLADIVTYDGDFGHIAGVTLWTPQDVI